MSIAPITRANIERFTAAARARPRKPEHGYRIDGEYVSVREIAQRLGINHKTISSRLSKLRNASGAITWARLRGEAS